MAALSPPRLFAAWRVEAPYENPNDEHPEDALPAPLHLRGRRDTLRPPQIQRGGLERNTFFIFLMAVFDVLPGILEVLLDLRLPHNFPVSRNLIISADLSKTTTSSAFKKYMGKMSFSRLFGYCLRDSSYMVRLYQAMQMQVA